jgi:hypothetical protein
MSLRTMIGLALLVAVTLLYLIVPLVGLGLSAGERWAVAVVGALLLLVVRRLAERPIWLDGLVAATAVLALTAGVWLLVDEPEPPPAAATATVQIQLANIARGTPRLDEKADVVLAVVTAKLVEDAPADRAVSRYEAELVDPIDLTARPSGSVQVKLERGEKDATLTQFVRDLTAAEVVYVFEKAS